MTHRVGVVVFDGVTLLDVSGPSEVLHQASQLDRHYELVLISAHGGEIKTSTGPALSGTVAASEAGRIDTVVVAGGDRLATQPVGAELLAVTRTVAARATRVASVCTGAFVLAELGLLDGRRATTHWRHADTLTRRHPQVRVEPDAIHVRDGRFVTSAGISAGIDLTLALVEDDHGAEVARSIARELVVFLQRPDGQAQFTTTTTAPARNDLLRTLINSVLADPTADHCLTSMASAVAVSPRHLTRLFHTELGTTPARWVERVRLDHAQQLLLDGHNVTSAARHSGLGSDETLRRAFARHLRTTPTAYRQRFATTSTVQHDAQISVPGTDHGARTRGNPHHDRAAHQFSSWSRLSGEEVVGSDPATPTGSGSGQDSTGSSAGPFSCADHFESAPRKRRRH